LENAGMVEMKVSTSRFSYFGWMVLRFLRANGWLILILAIALALRIYRLSFQSLWLDELHTMNEADPSLNWSAMIEWLRCCDQHPPLFFALERIAFSVFGYNEFVARIVPVFIGVASVWAMYFLGNVVAGKRLGLYCAALCCVNYFGIYYSQEARPYILSFLLATLLFAMLIRLIKEVNVRNAVWYAVTTLLMLYTHYFSFYVVVAQIVLGVFFFFQEPAENRKNYINIFLLTAGMLAIGYLPWFWVFLKITHAQLTWIPRPRPAFMWDVFYAFFGNAKLLKPFLLLLLFAFMMRVAIQKERFSFSLVIENPLQLSFVVVFVWIVVCNLLPYLQSLWSSPVVYPRYLIVVLPAYLLIIAYAIELFENRAVRQGILASFLILSMVHLINLKHYYDAVTKTQFREMTEYVVRENKNRFPIINELTSWHQEYYLKKFGSKAELITGSKNANIDSILQKTSSRFDVNGFWVVGAHGDKKPDTAVLKRLNEQFVLVDRKEFFDAWGLLYVRKIVD
jgi:uncharacterized membrane protein